jgi:TetR/AcrR family transcriptional repressor of nem operon
MVKVSVRDKIVTAAIQRFHVLGYSACGVQEIVDTAGVPKGSFYNYFKTKELLAREVLRNYWTGARFDVLTDKRLPSLDRLRKHFELIAANYKKLGFERGCLITKFINEVSDLTPDLQSDLEEGLERWASLIAETIRDGQADGTIANDIDANVAARFILDGWAGATGAMKLAAARAPLDEVIVMAFDVLLRTNAGQLPQRKARPKRGLRS